MSLRDQIANADDLSTEEIPVPEWDIVLTMRTPTLAERATMIRRFFNENGETKTTDLSEMYPALLIATCIDPETGAALFTQADADLLRSKNGNVVERVATVAMRLAGMSADAIPTQSVASSSTENASTITD